MGRIGSKGMLDLNQAVSVWGSQQMVVILSFPLNFLVTCISSLYLANKPWATADKRGRSWEDRSGGGKHSLIKAASKSYK